MCRPANRLDLEKVGQLAERRRHPRRARPQDVGARYPDRRCNHPLGRPLQRDDAHPDLSLRARRRRLRLPNAHSLGSAEGLPEWVTAELAFGQIYLASSDAVHS